jgi:hypothetical protein
MVKLLELNIPKSSRKLLVYHHHLQEQLHNYNHPGPSPTKEKRNCLTIFGPSPPKLHRECLAVRFNLRFVKF